MAYYTVIGVRADSVVSMVVPECNLDYAVALLESQGYVVEVR